MKPENSKIIFKLRQWEVGWAPNGRLFLHDTQKDLTVYPRSAEPGETDHHGVFYDGIEPLPLSVHEQVKKALPLSEPPRSHRGRQNAFNFRIHNREARPPVTDITTHEPGELGFSVIPGGFTVEEAKKLARRRIDV